MLLLLFNGQHSVGAVAATPVVDYDPTPDPSTVTFMAGVSTQCAVVGISEDSVIESERKAFTITATGGSGQISIPAPSVAVFISEDDCECNFQHHQPHIN